MSSKTPAVTATGTATGTGIAHGTIAEATKVEHLSSHTYSANFPNVRYLFMFTLLCL